MLAGDGLFRDSATANPADPLGSDGVVRVARPATDQTDTIGESYYSTYRIPMASIW